MSSGFWAKVHGGMTHFPIALVVIAAALDAAGLAAAGRPVARELHAAAYWAVITGALGSLGAVLSGVVMTNGSVLGHGALRMHHLYVWPAFALVIALATWRVIVGRRLPRLMLAGYLGALLVASALMLGAGYWGGELMMAR